MSTLVEKIRACVTLDEGAFAHVCALGSKALTLDVEDLTALADTVELGEQFDFDVSRATCAMSRELDLAKLEASEARGQAAALIADLDAAKAEIAALRAKLEESVGVAEAVAWRDGCSTFTGSKLVAQRWSEIGVSVTPLYLRPTAAEALPTREDLETVLRTAFDSGRVRLGADTVLFGERSGLIELNGRFYEREDKTPATFAQAVKVCADLVRAKKAEG